MQSLFNITAISTDYSNKQITIDTTFSIAPKTVNRKNVEVIAASSGTAVTYKLTVDDDKIIITLKDWPELEDFYVIKIVNVKDKLDRELIHPVTKQVTFKADTKLKVVITSPNNNEALVMQHSLVNFSIKQINPDGSEMVNPMPGTEELPLLPDNNNKEDMEKKEAMTEDELNVVYHFEFASDIAFFDIVKEYQTPYTNGYIQLENGQYYMRCRAIENNMNGDWSETITFTVVPEICEEDDNEISQSKKDYINDIMAPVEFFLNDADDIFEIISRSSNGVTYPEFYIEFNKDIDEDRLPDSIMAYRREL